MGIHAKVDLLVFSTAMLLGGSIIVFLALTAEYIFFRGAFTGAALAGLGGYLIWTDFIAPRFGIKTWED
jgi:hypothetical protein